MQSWTPSAPTIAKGGVAILLGQATTMSPDISNQVKQIEDLF